MIWSHQEEEAGALLGEPAVLWSYWECFVLTVASVVLVVLLGFHMFTQNTFLLQWALGGIMQRVKLS